MRDGLGDAGYKGKIEIFSWTSLLGPGADHLLAGSKAKGRKLAKRIQKFCADDPNCEIHMIGLSAGTAIVMSALEAMPTWVRVDYVVLLGSSVSGDRDLTAAMRHVKRRLYATVSPEDAVLSGLGVNADGSPGLPAGLRGFRPPPGATLGTEGLAAYKRVVNIPWKPAYMAYGWYGGHVQTTSSDFIRSVIAPRILDKQAYPLDRPVATTGAAPRRAEVIARAKGD